MPIVTMLNQKGGVGKTSTCHHLAGTLAGMGRRILLVDNDPQSSLTQGIFGPAYMAALDPGETIAGVYRGDEPLPSQVIRPTPFAGVDLLPGSEAATDHNVPRPHAAPWGDQAALREFLAEAAGGYDLTLIDCPPNLHLCSWAALAASDFLIVPLQAEDYGSQGLGPVRDSVGAVRSAINPRLALLGYLLTMYRPRAAIHQVYERNLRDAYGDDVFAAAVPDALDFKEAIGQRKTISAYKPKGASAKAVRAVADEMMARIDRAAAGRDLERGAA